MSAVAGCGNDAAGPEPCDVPVVELAGTGSVALNESYVVNVTSSVPLVGVDAAAHVALSVEAMLRVEGGGSSWTITVDGAPVGEHTLTVGGELVGVECQSTTPVAPANHTFRVDGPAWAHVGPVVFGAPAATPTTPLFADISDASGISSIGALTGRAMVVDFDGDGRDDIVTLPTTVPEAAPGETQQAMTPTFMRNVGDQDGDGVVDFVDASADSGMSDATMVVMAFGDLDNDGDQDAVSAYGFRAAGGEHGVWLNDGAGGFTFVGRAGLAAPEIGQAAAGTVYQEPSAIALADFNRDGLLDLYLGHWSAGDVEGGLYDPSADVLYLGDGAGGFSRTTLPDQHNPLTSQVNPADAGVPRRAYGLALGDIDDDGDLDLFVNNYGAGRPAAGSAPVYWDHNLLWRNDSSVNGLQLTDIGEAAGVAATTRGIGGVEQETPVTIGQTTYPGPIGGNGFGCQFGDLDNDGDLDLIIGTIAHPDYPQSDRTMLHYNQGTDANGVVMFSEESAERGLEYYEDELHPALVDIDNDGRLDIAMSRLRGGSKWEAYLQGADGTFGMLTSTDSGVDIERPGPTLWLDVDDDGDLDFFMAKGAGRLFENLAGTGNASLQLELVGRDGGDATGARVTLTSSVGTQVRELVATNGHYNSQLSQRLSFGLGGDSGARDVRVRWPDGSVETLGDVQAGLTLRVTQGQGVEIASDRQGASE